MSEDIQKKKAQTKISNVYVKHSPSIFNTPSVGVTMTPEQDEDASEGSFTKSDFMDVLEKVVKPIDEDEGD